MSNMIQDATGNGYWAKVDKNNRLSVKSISSGFNVEAALLGDNYNINSGVVNLTTDAISGVCYFESLETSHFVVTEIIVILGASTSGSGSTTVTVTKNPTAGTLISTATAGDTVENRNFSSSKELLRNFYKGATGATVTDGTTFAQSSRTVPSVLTFDADVIVLEKNNSLAVQVTPATGNTSLDVTVAIVGFVFDNGDS